MLLKSDCFLLLCYFFRPLLSLVSLGLFSLQFLMMLCPKFQTYSHVRYVLFINLVWPSLNIQSHDSDKMNNNSISRRKYPLANESANWPYYIWLPLALNRPFLDTHHLCMHFRIEWVKSSVKWVLRGQTSDKICQCKKLQLNMFIFLKWDGDLVVIQSVR